MFVKNEFSKHERIREDFGRIFGILDCDNALRECIGSVIDSTLSGSGQLNTKALGKRINDNLYYPIPVNTYPFGRPTNEIYPFYLAVCDRKSAFRKTLTTIVNHGIKYGGKVHEMVMLTNFWDSKDFKEYEESFNALYEKFGIRTSVILVTEYSANIVF